GQRKLRVDPLDLDHAADVSVEVQTAVRVVLAAAVRILNVSADDVEYAARRTGIVAREATVVGPALAVLQVDLETEHSLDPPDLEREVGAEPGPGIPLPVVVPGQVAVVEVPTHRRHLVEEPGDRDLGCRRLRECRGRRQRNNQECGENGDTDALHRGSSRMLSCFRIRYGSSTTGRLRDGTPLRDTNI